MFRKALKVVSNSVLKGSECKKLRARACAAFPRLSEETAAALLPSKADVAHVRLVRENVQDEAERRAHDQLSVYVRGADPVFFEVHGASQSVAPSLYTLWSVGTDWLPQLPIHPPVFAFLASGADLMLPGLAVDRAALADALPPFRCGDVGVLTVASHAVAVGVFLVSRDDVLRSGLRGRCMRVLHVADDRLWALGSRTSPFSSAIEELPCSFEMPSLDELRLGSEDGDGDGGDSEGAVQSDAAAAAAAPAAAAASEADEQSDSEAGAGAGAAASSSAEATSTADMDQALIRACARALHLLKDKELPILVSTFFSAFMIPQRDPDVQLDVKHSSFKKFNKFMATLAKQKLLSIKESKGVAQLTAVQRGHELYVQHPPIEATPSAGSAAAAAAEAAAASSGGGAPLLDGGVVVLSLYKARNAAQAAVFEGCEASSDPLYAAMHCFRHDEVQAAFGAYCVRLGCAKAPRAPVVLNDALVALLGGGKPGEQVRAGAALAQLLAQLEPLYHVAGDRKVRRGAAPRVKVIVQDRQGGRKHMTHIQNLEKLGLSPQEVAERASKKFAASATTQPLPGKNNGVETLVQGAILTELPPWLAEEFHVPVALIDVEDKRKKK